LFSTKAKAYIIWIENP